MAAAVADAAVGSSSAGAGADDVGVPPSGSGGGWVKGMDSVKEANDRLVSFVADLLARHGWTAIFLVIVWYNCKDAVKRRYRKWRNKRSLDDANRPDRRAVLDRERARSVAEKQAQALEDARAAAERGTQQNMQNSARTTTSTKDD
ncbi:unnamed protein product [Ectocarpus sp. 6 AP-2014]